MTKDYKNVPRSSAKKSGKRTPKKGSAHSKNKPARPTPGWVWMLGGLAIGLSVALLVYLADGDGEGVKGAKQALQQTLKPRPEPAQPDTDTSEDEGQRFDFYTLLPELEVIIPESEIEEGQARIKARDDVAYMIQVGSFRAYGEADSLKAQLALLGIEADIEPVSSRGEQWLRVRVGPFTSKREMNKVRNRLHSNDINTMLVQIKK